jgi:hypothetical protein
MLDKDHAVPRCWPASTWLTIVEFETWGPKPRQRTRSRCAIMTGIGEHWGLIDEGDYDGRLANFLFASLFSLQESVNNEY